MSLPLFGAYAASKHALEAMSDAMRYELRDQGVQVGRGAARRAQASVRACARPRAAAASLSLPRGAPARGCPSAARPRRAVWCPQPSSAAGDGLRAPAGLRNKGR